MNIHEANFYNLSIFKNEEFGSIRTFIIDGEHYFVGKDIAEKLGYSNVNKAIQMHVDEEDKKILDFKGFSQFATNLWKGNDFSNKILINESGVYSLIFESELPSAKEFKRLVTKEILPSIHKQGFYAIDQLLDDPEALLKEVQRLVDKKKAYDQAKVNLAKESTKHISG